MKKVSVIISTYNRQEDLRKTLDSLSSQTVLPYELIIVDESTDGSIKKLIKDKKLPFKKRYFHRDAEYK
ncbi:MAG: glycosyltransferase, partial [Candidatus Aenigmarchaeota archaeon]|nr:glycosyltransferase [Candidatus Aenigmarchaeota archaeon]